MAVYKEPNANTWRVVYRYTDVQGNPKQTTKRGFATKREAVAWERETKLRNILPLSDSFGIITWKKLSWHKTVPTT